MSPPGGPGRRLAAALREELGSLLRPGPPPPPGLPRLATLWPAAAAAAVLSALAYLALGAAVVASGVLLHHNQVFDLDPGRFVDLFARDRSTWDETTFAVDVRVKHPWILLLRPPALLLVGLGLSPEWATTLLAAAAGGGTVGLVLLLLRSAGARPPEAAAVTALFAASSAQLTAAAIVESYVFAALGLAWLHLVTVRRLAEPELHPRSRLLAPLFLFAVTSTNVLQAAAAEAVLRLRGRGRDGLDDGLGVRRPWRLAAWCLVLAPFLVLGGAYALETSPAALLTDPAGAVKQVMWIGVLEEEGPKAPVTRQVATYLLLSFVACRPTPVPVENEPWDLLDFRSFEMTPLGSAASAVWLALLAAGVVTTFASRRHRAWGVILAACFLLNVGIHMLFQYRQSLYLVTPHVHVVVLGFVATLAAWTGGRGARVRGVFVVGVVGLAGVVAWNNVGLHLEVVRAFGP